MSEALEPPDFECPICKSMVQQKNLKKHLLNRHNDTGTIHKYQPCPICGGLFLKHKLTPHLYKIHNTAPGKNQRSHQKPEK